MALKTFNIYFDSRISILLQVWEPQDVISWSIFGRCYQSVQSHSYALVFMSTSSSSWFFNWRSWSSGWQNPHQKTVIIRGREFKKALLVRSTWAEPRPEYWLDKPLRPTHLSSFLWSSIYHHHFCDHHHHPHFAERSLSSYYGYNQIKLEAYPRHFSFWWMYPSEMTL